MFKIDRLKEIYNEIFLLKKQLLPTTIFNSLVYINCKEMMNHYIFLTPTPANLKFLDMLMESVPTVSINNECDLEDRDKNLFILKHLKKHLKENIEPNFDQYFDSLKKSAIIIKRDSGIDDYMFASKIFSQWSKTRTSTMRKIKITDTLNNVTQGFMKYANKHQLFNVPNAEFFSIEPQDDGFTVSMYMYFHVDNAQSFIELTREKLINFVDRKKEEAISTCHNIFNYTCKIEVTGFRNGYSRHTKATLFMNKPKSSYAIETNLRKASIDIGRIDNKSHRKDCLFFKVKISKIPSEIIKEMIFKSLIDKQLIKLEAISNGSN